MRLIFSLAVVLGMAPELVAAPPAVSLDEAAFHDQVKALASRSPPPGQDEILPILKDPRLTPPERALLDGLLKRRAQALAPAAPARERFSHAADMPLAAADGAAFFDRSGLGFKLRSDLVEGRYAVPVSENKQVSFRLGGLGMNPEPLDPLRSSFYSAAQGTAHCASGGSVDCMARATVGMTHLRGRTIVPDAGDLQSPASGGRGDAEPTENTANTWLTASAHAHLSKGFRLLPGMGLGLFGGIGAWGMLNPESVDGTQGDVSANLGAALSHLSGPDAFRAYINAQGRLGKGDFYRNLHGRGTLAAILEGLYGGAEYTHYFNPGEGARLAVEAIWRSYLWQVNPSAAYFNERVRVMLEGHLQNPQGPNAQFFPQERGARASVAIKPVEGVELGVDGSYNQVQYGNEASPRFSLNSFARFVLGDGGKRVAAAVGHNAATQVKLFDAAAARAAIAPMQFPNRAFFEKHDLARAAMASSAGYDEFVAKAASNVGSYDQMLGLASALGQKWDVFNYNKDESHDHPNLNSQEAIFGELQKTWLDPEINPEKAYRPVGVCATESLFEARLVNAIAREKGWNVRAIPLAFQVQGEKGTGNHTAIAVFGPDGKISFQDWSHILHSGTANVEDAFRTYVGLTGVPTMAVRLIDPDTGAELAQIPLRGDVMEGPLGMDGALVPGTPWGRLKDPKFNNITLPLGAASADKAALGQ